MEIIIFIYFSKILKNAMTKANKCIYKNSLLTLMRHVRYDINISSNTLVSCDINQNNENVFLSLPSFFFLRTFFQYKCSCIPAVDF
jgi:hypothetical protein